MNGTKEKAKLNYFFVKLLIIITHVILLATVGLNGVYDNVSEVYMLSAVVLASDIFWYIVIGSFKQDTYTLDYLLVLIINVSLIFQSCFGGVHFNLKHFITLTAGMIAYHAGYLFTRNSFRAEKMRPYCYAGLGLLAMIILLFTGDRSMWIDFGSFTVQPSEFMKPLIVLVCASSLQSQQTKKQIGIFNVSPNNIAMILVSACVLILQWWCRDLGSIPTFAAVTGCAVINRIFYPKAKLSKKKIGVLAAGVLVLALIAIKLAPSYVKDRLYVDIWADQYGNGYQQCRALIGMAEGGWLGKGPGAGKLCNVFAYDTDIVFSSVAEEWGLLGAVLFVVLILLMLATTLINTPKCYYHGTVAVGVTAVFIVQMSLNIFGSCNLIPFTGVTLPFLSNGGTSMVTSGFLIGMLKASQCPVFIRNIVEIKPSETAERRRASR
ncbi:MAG: FtsW/RodA/SpoVE family cell cycle protein [Oscillospiraceae bacterium]|nr:FtsW/RodA/SpoVE family cell cycle protein [Oscillospiraceae bacterium]